MSKKSVYIYLILLTGLIFLSSSGIHSQSKSFFGQQDLVQIPIQYENKILSGKLIERVSRKLYDAKTGNIDASASAELVSIYFSSYPTETELFILSDLGIKYHLDTWTPALDNHPYGFLIAELPVGKLNNVVALDYVKKINTAEGKTYPLNNESAKKIKADSVWLKGYTGTGIKVGILDSGLDTQPANSDLPAVIEKRDYSNYPTVDTTVENSITGHGTHVAGTILGRGVLSVSNTGNGGGAYKGMAPDAGLVFLKIGNDVNASASDAATIAAAHAAVDTFHAKVLSMSYGGWDEYHDGSSASEQTIDWVYSKGVPFFISAGNDGATNRHYSSTVPANDTSGFIQINVASAGTNSTKLFFNLVWSDGIGVHNNLNLIYYDNSYTNLTAVTHYLTTESSRGTESQYSNYDNYVPSGSSTYYVRVVNPSSNSQFFHIFEDWGDRKVKFNSPDRNYTVGGPATADHAFAVAAYVSRNVWTDYSGSAWTYGYTLNDIAPFSSRGPRVDGTQKPNIAAPGSVVISIRDRDVYTSPNTSWVDNDGTTGGDANYLVMQGTSMACPVAAGAAALVLSSYPTATPDQVYDTISSNAISDAYTGSLPNSTWGYGKLDVNAAVETILPEQYAVSDRWNMVSVPLKVNDARKTNLFPMATSSAFSYGSGYVAKDTLVNGVGYWLKFNGDQNVFMNGSPNTVDTIDVITGWNLIGSVSSPVSASSVFTIPSGIIISEVYGYDGGYSVADSVKPAKAYWIKARESGKVVLDASGIKKK
jgi:subtilisin family serine protease